MHDASKNRVCILFIAIHLFILTTSCIALIQLHKAYVINRAIILTLFNWQACRHFTQSLLDFPLNPFEGRFGNSTFSVYRSCLRVVDIMGDIGEKQVGIVARTWWFWQLLYNAGVRSSTKSSLGYFFIVARNFQIDLGLLVVRAPACEAAQAAFRQLEFARRLLQSRCVLDRAVELVVSYTGIY